ncbi:putative beta-hexosaminidase [Flavihumibacter petaseus NBRC 106054]|uniref:beta-N-acetylhexosaminidase n=2 Tax=Flavihumibacter TaxID=1004301 RepID=A0A0E9N1N1_9BACT|nr:putative beta-hexosaminidase [Flavihumibacter petaseus NBRC 106054]
MFILLLTLITLNIELNAQKGSSYDLKKLSIEWQLTTNRYEDGSRALNTLIITNTDKRPFPASGWIIYFSSAREMLPSSPSNGLSCTHVNGDIYQLVPQPGFTGIEPGKSIRTNYITNGFSYNKSGAPTGMYLVWGNQPEKGIPLDNYRIGNNLDTTQVYKTPEAIFTRNTLYSAPDPARLSPVFPTPESFERGTGNFELTSEVAILCGNEYRKEAEFLATALQRVTGKQPVIATAFIRPVRSIQFLPATLPDESYSLMVDTGQVTIQAGSASGFFYGVQSLLTMMPGETTAGRSVSLPVCRITDKPRFGYRSLMVDIGRNFQTKAELKKMLDLMALYKLNTLHLHFSEDEGWRIEMPSLPELTAVGAQRGHPLDSKKNLPPSFGAGPLTGKMPASGYYSRNDFIEILRYASARHIRIIPEVETPGHARAAIKAMDARYDAFSKSGNMTGALQYLLRDTADQSRYSTAQAWTDNVMCVALPSVYSFIERVVDDFRDMYREAGVPLKTIHMGGDEVPDGAWEKSPACLALLKQDSSLTEINDLWYYYYTRVAEILRKRNIEMAGWEEVGMRKTKLAGVKKLIVNPRLANEGYQLHVWNNMVGWGNEDLPYRLANAGYKVILSPVSNNYFDMSYYKHPDEPGFYWGGFTDVDKPFYFIPFDYFRNTTENANGDAVRADAFVGKDLLTDYGKSNIIGLEGLIWSETIRSEANLEYMVLPKLLGLAERAWAPDPAWANEKDTAKMNIAYRKAWSDFAYRIGVMELPRLSTWFGGYRYRIPAPGLVVDAAGVQANLQLPGFTLRYSTDGSEPDLKSRIFTGVIREKGVIRIKAFDKTGRGGRSVSVTVK